MKKRIMSILLCLILALGMLPTVAFADGGTVQLSEVIVNEAETVIEDDKTAFTFTIKANDTGNDYYKTITVAGGSIKELTDLPAGSYTITQTQQTGYTICAISGAAETNYYKDYYVINVNEGTDNPVVTFINTKLSEMSSFSIKRPPQAFRMGRHTRIQPSASMLRMKMAASSITKQSGPAH